MSLKRIPLLLLAIASAASIAIASASAAPAAGGATVVIKHALRGCHVWSVNGDTFKASQSVTLRRGAVLSLVNNDLMPHTFILKSGPSVTISHPTLAKIGASLAVKLTKPGTYHFMTKAGEDYKSAGDVKTIGEDNVLRLTVVVH
jgi:plastocyanin